ncbi:MAG: hypothetical protein IJ682_07595 [Lachnospiraceae bacterium]|nr:hypothetical protein [Lachnospiraceae bacterium]
MAQRDTTLPVEDECHAMQLFSAVLRHMEFTPSLSDGRRGFSFERFP